MASFFLRGPRDLATLHLFANALRLQTAGRTLKSNTITK
jgi:hypothetical protein